jgi:alpha-1,3-glucosyltransferase
VHEKAILLVIIPFSLIALNDRRHLGAFRPLAVAGHVSLFPLLFTASEFPVKVAYTIFWLMAFLLAFDRLAPALVVSRLPSSLPSQFVNKLPLMLISNWPPQHSSPNPRYFLFDRFSLLYTAIAIPLIAYCSLGHSLFFGARYEFLPLMFISSYSAVGVVASWIGFLVVFFDSWDVYHWIHLR